MLHGHTSECAASSWENETYPLGFCRNKLLQVNNFAFNKQPLACSKRWSDTLYLLFWLYFCPSIWVPLLSRKVSKWSVFLGNYQKGELKRRILSKKGNQFYLDLQVKCGCYDNVKWHAKISAREKWSFSRLTKSYEKEKRLKRFYTPLYVRRLIAGFSFKLGVN